MILYPNQGAGLCNRLHAAANLIAFAEATGQTVAFLSLRKYAPYFEGLPERGPFIYRPSHPRPRRWRIPVGWLRSGRFRQPRLSYRDPEVQRIVDRTAWLLLTGWRFRDDQSLKEHGELVRRIFTPQPLHQLAIDRCTGALRGQCASVVGVHIRRTDYATFQEGRFWYEDAVYRRWMNALQAVLPNPVGFLIASDAPVDLTAFDGLTVRQAPGHELQDLYALAACDYLIGPPSTYTSWASFYGQVPLWHGTSADAVPSPTQFKVHS